MKVEVVAPASQTMEDTKKFSEVAAQNTSDDFPLQRRDTEKRSEVLSNQQETQE